MDCLFYKGYNGSVEYSDEDNCLFGKVSGLKDSLILYEGNSLEELKKDFMGAIDLYLDGCKEDGIQPEIPYNLFFNISIPPELHSRVTRYSENSGTPVNSFICNAIERCLETV
jgi:predicted HicB family RNase H-like nuclease